MMRSLPRHALVVALAVVSVTGCSDGEPAQPSSPYVVPTFTPEDPAD